jgi:hypothetical protein
MGYSGYWGYMGYSGYWGYKECKMYSGIRGRDGTGTGDRPVRSGPVPFRISDRPVSRSTDRSPFDRSVTVRPVSYRSTGQLPFDRPVAVRPVSHRSTGRSPFDQSVTVRPAGHRSTGHHRSILFTFLFLLSYK